MFKQRIAELEKSLEYVRKPIMVDWVKSLINLNKRILDGIGLEQDERIDKAIRDVKGPDRRSISISVDESR